MTETALAAFCANCIDGPGEVRQGRFTLCRGCAGKPLFGPRESDIRSAAIRGNPWGGSGYLPTADEQDSREEQR